MILFSLLSILAFIPYALKKKLTSFVLVFGLCLIVFAFFLLEFFLGRVDYLISDGFVYFDDPEDWIANIDRSFWGYVNYIEKCIDPLGHVFIKIINIPILLLLLYYIQKTFPIVKSPASFVFFFPYILFLSISNLRDLLIWLFAILIVRNYNKRKIQYYLLAIVYSIALYMLRPFMLASVWIALVLFEIAPFIRNFIRKIEIKKVLSFLAFALLFLIVLIVANPVISKKIHSYRYNATYLIMQGYEERAKLRKADDVIDTSNLPKAIFMSHVRYVLTPVPNSILKRMFSADLSTEYGLTSEVLRLINQLVYYYLLIWILFNLTTVIRSLRKFNFEQRAFLIWLLTFLPVYSIAHFGGSHQRLKLPFQILILLIFIYARHYKKLRKKAKEPSLAAH